MTKEQLAKLSLSLSIEGKCVVFIMDMLRQGEISRSSSNKEVYEKFVSKLDECSGVAEAYQKRLEELRTL